MVAEIISVGTELLMGQIVDTNSQYLSRQLSEMGIDVYYKTTVGDNAERMRGVITQALERSDIVITTGGLGPTADDITKETVAELMCMPLYMHVESLDAMRERFKALGRNTVAEINNKQALMPQGGTVMPNPKGTAPGCIMDKNGKIAIVLPGPPFEMAHMFENYAKPYLAERTDSRLVSHFVRIIGMGESTVAEILADIIDKQTNPTLATYASSFEVQVRITAKCGKNEDAEAIIAPVEKQVLGLLGDYVYSVGEEPLSKVVADMLIRSGKTLAVAESCTGGWLCSEMVHYAGSSAYMKAGIVSYSNEAKARLLGVPANMLQQYGAVSEEVATAMAIGARLKTGSDYAVSTTGVAGPDGGTDEKPVGLVYIAIATPDGVDVVRHTYASDRTRNRQRAVQNAINMLRLQLLKDGYK